MSITKRKWQIFFVVVVVVLVFLLLLLLLMLVVLIFFLLYHLHLEIVVIKEIKMVFFVGVTRVSGFQKQLFSIFPVVVVIVFKLTQNSFTIPNVKI